MHIVLSLPESETSPWVALFRGALPEAALDLFRKEPLPPGHPFWTRPEITVTPHASGLTNPDATVAQVARRIRALDRGLPVTGIVDCACGY
ncbi:MAG: NAD(P)-dependent oxidoreductase [Betaproteobacteria bacterium]